MPLPKDLIFVRHGESEGNVLTKASRNGDDSLFTDELMRRHSSKWRLTDLGRKQAPIAGEWIRKNVGTKFHRYLCSTYDRAMETAALLGLPNASWQPDLRLRERDMGLFDILPEAEKRAHYADVYQDYLRDPIFWGPPGGESLAQLCSNRLEGVMETMRRKDSEASDPEIIVAHGMVMSAAMIILEHMTPQMFAERLRSDHPRDKIHNCQILHYTRRREDGTLSRGMVRVRSICPWDLSLSSNEWRAIVRPRYSNEQLLEIVNQTPQIVV